jgi:hypothetical protein
MARVIDYWRGLVSDIREARSNSPEHLREVGDLWYPVLQMRVLAAVHSGAERRLGPVDLPAAHAEQVARHVWQELLAAMHKRVAPHMWPQYAAVIASLVPWLCRRLGVEEGALEESLLRLTSSQLENLADEAFRALYPAPLPSRDEQTARGAITAFLYRNRPWPDLGTWIPFTLYSLTARYFEQGPYLGLKRCNSETEILDLVEMEPFGRRWAEDVILKRAHARTAPSYLDVLHRVLDGRELPAGGATIARRLTLVEWLSDPEARLARLVAVQGTRLSESVVARSFRAQERPLLLGVLRAAAGIGAYPDGLDSDARRTALLRLLEAMEGCAVRTELLVHSGRGGDKRGAEWARSVVRARAPRSDARRQAALLDAIVARRDVRAIGPVSQRTRSLRSLHRLLRTASRPDAGIRWELCGAASGTR